MADGDPRHGGRGGNRNRCRRARPTPSREHLDTITPRERYLGPGGAVGWTVAHVEAVLHIPGQTGAPEARPLSGSQVVERACTASVSPVGSVMGNGGSPGHKLTDAGDLLAAVWGSLGHMFS